MRYRVEKSAIDGGACRKKGANSPQAASCTRQSRFFADADELETTGQNCYPERDAADTKVLRQIDELLTLDLY